MANERAAGKKLIGAQASAAIWAGVDEWLRRNPRQSVSDFVLEACMEKLDACKIPYDRAAAMIDGRRRQPGAAEYSAHRPDFMIMNDSSASMAASQVRLKQKAFTKP